MDKFRALMHQLEYYRNHNNEFRNCQNTWLYVRKLNLFLAISDIEMLGIGDEHHGFMLKNKSCLLINMLVCDPEIIGILIQNPLVVEE